VKAFRDIVGLGRHAARADALPHRRPRLDSPLALAPDAYRDLTDANARLDDPFARIGLTVLRGTGLRLGELLGLELECVWDSASHGS
jgi:integrase